MSDLHSGGVTAGVLRPSQRVLLARGTLLETAPERNMSPGAARLKMAVARVTCEKSRARAWDAQCFPETPAGSSARQRPLHG